MIGRQQATTGGGGWGRRMRRRLGCHWHATCTDAVGSSSSTVCELSSKLTRTTSLLFKIWTCLSCCSVLVAILMVSFCCLGAFKRERTNWGECLCTRAPRKVVVSWGSQHSQTANRFNAPGHWTYPLPFSVISPRCLASHATPRIQGADGVVVK